MMNHILKKAVGCIGVVLGFSGCWMGSLAFAEVAMVKLSLHPATWEDPEEFPESRFGSPPNPPLSNSALVNLSRGGNGGRALASIQPNLSAIAGPRSGVQEIALIAGDLGFFPRTLFVTRDIPVKLFVTGASKRPLCMMMDPFQVRKQIRSQKVEEVDFTPSTAGMFRFYCPINGMEGTLYVKDPSNQGDS